ncbi:hypothetical protein ANRL3_02317 [Anaerolineae bacterium]|nr:hypothetical protein ANRL3_02317 [Anaerolineae bacterium]
MPNPKPNYTDLVHQVVRESPEPLPFAEIMQRVNAIERITTKHPEGTIRNAISQSRLIVNTGNARYGWKYRVINGSVLRLTLSESDCRGMALEFTEELRDALWPAFFALQKRADRNPVNLQLPDGQTTRIPLDHFRETRWGTKGSPELWQWFKSVRAEPGDALILRVLDGEARLYAVEFQPRAARDESAIVARNQQVLQASLEYFRRTVSGAELWDISSHLLATGQYKHPVPPDSLEKLWTRDLWEPELAKKPVRGGWVYVGRDDSDAMIASLIEQLRGETPFSKKKREQASIFQVAIPNSIYQLKVTLQDSHPAIWRRIQVPDNILLPQLHGVLQLAMGWTNSHLHWFKKEKQIYTEPSGDFGFEVIDYRTVRLNQIAPRVKDRFIYLYDFGDSWEHDIVVEKILSPEKDVQYPHCLDGKRACPPDDVGGVWGYADFVKAIRNPRHPEHDEMLEWVGGKFDPEKFDLDGVNGMLLVFQSTLAYAARKR